MADIRWVWNEAELFRLLESYEGPVGRHLDILGEKVKRGAQRRAPVSANGSDGRPPGYTKSKIRWDRGRDPLGQYRDISSPARTRQGEPLGLFLEVGTRPHVIRPRNPNGWLRWVGSDGKVHFAKKVNHPGTRAQPHLRPALEDLRGA
ncbi:hypothetical protein [Nonomuraea roseoviolacea]|uniref:HK97 gp10 family phage protein n=1 Tax=Nonomuraea roseoviolacea subsp. carminata TaxID=160689 RepID=A0ABT1K9C4_9ACTN|nr:hypothetical protein [Nonomuraea roseoviolacea]MCP2350618.1 hypothetical protein [Nonomuraea roseoviolacea subsp. carminata]